MVVFMIMTIQFKSIRLPLVMLFAIPVSLIGIVLALMAAGQGLSVIALMGILMVIGIAVSNGILLVDEASRRSERGGVQARRRRRSRPHPVHSDRDDEPRDGHRARPDGDRPGARDGGEPAAGAHRRRRPHVIDAALALPRASDVHADREAHGARRSVEFRADADRGVLGLIARASPRPLPFRRRGAPQSRTDHEGRELSVACSLNRPPANDSGCLRVGLCGPTYAPSAIAEPQWRGGERKRRQAILTTRRRRTATGRAEPQRVGHRERRANGRLTWRQRDTLPDSFLAAWRDMSAQDFALRKHCPFARVMAVCDRVVHAGLGGCAAEDRRIREPWLNDGTTTEPATGEDQHETGRVHDRPLLRSGCLS